MPPHRRPRSPAPASIPSYRRFRSPARTTTCAHPSALPSRHRIQHRRPRSPAPAPVLSYRRFRSPARTHPLAHPSATPSRHRIQQRDSSLHIRASGHVPASPPAITRPRIHTLVSPLSLTRLHYNLRASIRTPIAPSHPASRQPDPHPRVKPCPALSPASIRPCARTLVLSPANNRSPHPYPRIAAFAHPPALQLARIHPHSHRAIASSIAAARSTPARHAMPPHRRPRSPAPAPIPSYRRFRSPARTHSLAHPSAPPSRHRIQHRGSPLRVRAPRHAPHRRPRSPAPAPVPSYRRFRSPARAHRQKIAARENLLTRRCHTRGVRRALRAALSRCGE